MDPFDWDAKAVQVVSCSFCPYCLKLCVSGLADHFRHNHVHQPTVAKLKKMQPGDRLVEYKRLRKLGNWRNNLNTIVNRKGILAVCTPKGERASENPNDYDFCRGCFGWLMRGEPLKRHRKEDRCRVPTGSGESVFGTKTAENLKELAADYTNRDTEDGRPFGYEIKEEDRNLVFEKIVKPIKDEHRRNLILSDPLIVHFAARRLRCFNPPIYTFR